MQVSIIIVNYNVKYFLEHCLLSVRSAIVGLDAEVFVVDNCSSDGSVEMVQQKFPEFVLLANKENIGFAKANNQAVLLAKGEYILYLNPDTIVPEDCFQKCYTYMNEHAEVGALGCRLIDGKGEFLPESKRGFPSAEVAFYKISGLSSLFKKSKIFNKYHLGNLDEFEINEVDVLVGCFMWCRKKVIDEVGSFDEEYFMYGEDIDLSYKISKVGFKNIYFPDTTVIHYKGESTKKGSLNYVRMFYQAMIIFAKKHFQGSKKGAFVLLIHLAIYLRGIIAFIARMFGIIRLPLVDSGVLLFSLAFMKMLWIKNVKVNTHYSSQLLFSFFITYILIWILSIYFSGGYDKPYKSTRVLRGMLMGGVITLVIYALLPEQIRFSRSITVFGALLGTLLIVGWRKLFYWLGVKELEDDSNASKKVILVGNTNDEQAVKKLLEQAHIQKNIIGLISSNEHREAYQLATFSDIVPIAKVYDANEIIYVQHQLSFKHIIESIQQLGSKIEYKIHSRGTDSIIGSNSKNTAGDLYSTELVYTISTPSSKRNKRVVDILFSCAFLLLSPLLIWFAKNKSRYFLNHVLVLEGDKTYIGYTDKQFPSLKPSLLDVFPRISNFYIPSDNQEHLNWLYAKNYSPWMDVKLIVAKWRYI
jgi:O-antigen biosynthesis protein